MLELSSWNVHCLVFKYKLLKLSGDHFSSFDWLHYMLGLYRWLVLRNLWTVSRDRSMRSGILLVIFSDGLLKLSFWNLRLISFIDKLH